MAAGQPRKPLVIREPFGAVDGFSKDRDSRLQTMDGEEGPHESSA